ncbi:aminoglycoside phosphotransferase family protein [Rhizobium sp. SGZ-381]|uniref:aminoglycoside phosphotransferase family protein n=1 Tax=Rhizobium sp. SGZ-381 TaxID=3342800 RepID=UPI00366F9228
MMHVDELIADEEAVFRLIEAQAPEWADLALSSLASTGTDNWLFRLGDAQVLRLPRRPSAIALMAKELDWLPHLQGLSLDVPHLRFRGHADLGTLCEFGIFDWMDGDIASADAIANWADAAQALARFLLSLQAKSTAGAPRAGPSNSRRGVPLHDLNDVTLSSIDVLCDEIDVSAAKAIWHKGLSAPYAGPGVWLHGDLKADNLIARCGALAGVIDWGLAAIGDPAADYASAWSWVDPSARDVFRTQCAIDDGDWHRARAWALYGAVIALSYYRGGKNEALCRQSRQTLTRLGLLL